MLQGAPGAPKSTWFQHVSRGVALAASTGAALISVITALFSYGVIGKSESHQSIGNFGAAWVKLRPTIDTATAIGDTIHYAATIADRSGSILVGAQPTWTTGDTNVAVVGPDGAVIARGPGLTTVSVVVGTLVANSRIFVKQQVAGVAVFNPAGDTAVILAEGSQLQLQTRALDARGHTVPGRVAQWHIDDTSVATLDARGVLIGRNAGRSVVSAKMEGTAGYLPVSIVTTASALALVSGTNQQALAGRVLPQRVVVRATSRKGAPAAGKVVTFRLADPQGKVEPSVVMTDADGRARTTWTLGDTPGRQTLLASVENVDSLVAVVAEAEPVASNTRVTALAEQLRARAGVLLADSVGVRVTDSSGHALGDLPVRWTAIDGSVDAAAPRTDSLGIARAHWTLASKTGTQRLRAYVGGANSRVAPVTVAATALPGAPATIFVVSGDRQHTAAGAVLPKSVVLRALDANGNGAADVPVMLSLSGGAVPDTDLVTDTAGFARTRWTLGHAAGDYWLAVHVDGIKKLLKVAARATPAAPANLSFDDAQTGEKTSRPRVKRLHALVTDIYGNPVPDAPVNLTVKSGAITPARAVTDAKGRIALTWVLGAKTGDQALNGIVRGTDVTGAYLTQVTQSGAPKTNSTKTRPRKSS
jgi:hypothetical protein